MKNNEFRIKKIDISEHDEYRGGVMVQKNLLSENVDIHWHNYYEIEYVTEGCATEITNGGASEITPGVMHILSPSDFHELRIDRAVVLTKICFDISDVTADVFPVISGIQKQIFRFEGADKDLFDTLFHSALTQKAIYGGTELYPLMSKKILEAILLNAAEYARGGSPKDQGEVASPEKRGDINATLAYIQSNYTNHIRLADVAEKTHFSPSYLSRYFHKTVGMTFVQYVKNLRIEMAAKLLANTDLDVTAVCYEIGYSSPASFSNEFRKAYKVSPTEYRKISKKKLFDQTP